SELGNYDSQIFLHEYNLLTDKLKQFNKEEPVLLIIDEVDKLFPDRELKNSQEVLIEYLTFFKMLRALAQTRQNLVLLSVAYRTNINRHNQLFFGLGENPMFQSYQEFPLGFLDADESKKLIQEIGSWKQIKWSDEAAEKAFYYCGGHPLVT